MRCRWGRYCRRTSRPPSDPWSVWRPTVERQEAPHRPATRKTWTASWATLRDLQPSACLRISRISAAIFMSSDRNQLWKVRLSHRLYRDISGAIDLSACDDKQYSFLSLRRRIFITLISRLTRIADNNTVLALVISHTMRYYVSITRHERLPSLINSLIVAFLRIGCPCYQPPSRSRSNIREIQNPASGEARIDPRIGCIQSLRGRGVITMITYLSLSLLFRSDQFSLTTLSRVRRTPTRLFGILFCPFLSLPATALNIGELWSSAT